MEETTLEKNDAMIIKSNYLARRILGKIIKKKLGIDAEVVIDTLRLETYDDGTAYARIEAGIATKTSEIHKLLERIGL